MAETDKIVRDPIFIGSDQDVPWKRHALISEITGRFKTANYRL